MDIYNLAIYDKNGTVFYEVKKKPKIWTILRKRSRVPSVTGATVGSTRKRRESRSKPLLLFRFSFRDTRGGNDNAILDVVLFMDGWIGTDGSPGGIGIGITITITIMICVIEITISITILIMIYVITGSLSRTFAW